MRVLVIEDSPSDAKLVSRSIEESSIDIEMVTHVNNGEEAQAFLESIPTSTFPQFAICDLNMPKMNGLEFMAWLRGHENILISALPVIGITGLCSQRRVRLARLGGFSLVVKKPMHIEEWDSMIEDMLKFLSDWCL